MQLSEMDGRERQSQRAPVCEANEGRVSRVSRARACEVRPDWLGPLPRKKWGSLGLLKAESTTSGDRVSILPG